MSVKSAGAVGIDLVLKGGKYEQQVAAFQNKANYAAEKISGSFKKMGTAVAAALSTKVIIAFGKECTELGSNLAEVQNVVDVTFTSMNSKLNEWAKNATASYGLSETMAKKYAGLYGSMASAFGFAEGQAYDMATTLAGLSGDVASFYNISQDEAYTKLKAVFSGETEALKDLGIVLTQSALDAYALSNGFGKTVQQMTEAEKVSLRYNFVLDQLANAQGDFTRTQDSWANQVRILQLRFDSLKATIGQGLITALTPAIKFLNTMIERVQVLADAFSSMMTKLFGVSDSTANAISSTVVAEELLTDSADESATAVDGVTNSIKKSSNVAKGSVASFDKLNVLTKSTSGTSSSGSLSSMPISRASTNFPSQGGAEGEISSLVDSLKSKFANLYEKSGFGSIVSSIQREINKVDWTPIKNNCNNTLESLKSGFGNLSTFFNNWSGLIGDSFIRMSPKWGTAVSGLLGGLSNYATTISTVVADAFEIASESLLKWIDKDNEEISLFFDNIQKRASDRLALVGDVFSDLGTTISEWWNGEGGSSVFADMCDMFTNIGTTFMNVWNDWIQPVWDFFADVVGDAWKSTLSPVFDSVLSVFGKLGETISTLWNNVLSPVVNWFIDVMEPIITNTLNAIKRVFNTVFDYIGGIISSALLSFGGLLDFVSGVFSGDWEKAWQGIKDYFAGIWNGIATTLAAGVNLIVDGINLLWIGIYNKLSYVVNSIGDIVQGAGDLLDKDWGFSMPEQPALIPRWEPNIKLAKGGIVKAPTLAVVGDNPGAANGDPEVVSPLSKLQSMINTSSGQDVVILTQILDYLKRIYEMFVVFRNNGGNMFEFIATLDDEVIFQKMIKQNELYKKRNNGESAF